MAVWELGAIDLDDCPWIVQQALGGSFHDTGFSGAGGAEKTEKFRPDGLSGTVPLGESDRCSRPGELLPLVQRSGGGVLSPDSLPAFPFFGGSSRARFGMLLLLAPRAAGTFNPHCRSTGKRHAPDQIRPVLEIEAIIGVTNCQM